MDSDDLSPGWRRARPAYETLKQAKREHRRAIRAFNSAEIALMRAAKNALKTTISQTTSEAVAAIMEPLFDEETISEIVIDKTTIGTFPVSFLKAKDKYNASIAHLNETLKDVETAERAYIVAVLKNLSELYRMNISEMAEVFGIWNNTLASWMREIDDADEDA